MLYIHIPFCKGKCIYCDFYSSGNPDWRKYLKAVVSELSIRIEELRDDCLSSIYLGGGTPSLIPANLFYNFIDDIYKVLDRSDIQLDKDLEFTLEVNPEDVELSLVNEWKKSGVNRISMGVQSMNDSELSFLHRRHSADKVKFATEYLKKYFNNISVDIIYGIPGQTEETLSNTLKQILDLSVQHISAYSLTYEPKTALYIKRNKGEVEELEEDQYNYFEDIVFGTLEKEGFERYEISNYSLPGFRSRHNCGYWEGKKYIGLGPSACSYDGNNVRKTNPADIRSYLRFFSEPQEKRQFYDEEKLSDKELIEERIMTSLRTKNGIDLDKFKQDFGALKHDELIKSSNRWIKNNDLSLTERNLSLTLKGIKISDYIILDLIP